MPRKQDRAVQMQTCRNIPSNKEQALDTDQWICAIICQMVDIWQSISVTSLFSACWTESSQHPSLGISCSARCSHHMMWGLIKQAISTQPPFFKKVCRRPKQHPAWVSLGVGIMGHALSNEHADLQSVLLEKSVLLEHLDEKICVSCNTLHQSSSAVERLGAQVCGNLGLPAVTVFQKLLLVIQQLLCHRAGRGLVRDGQDMVRPRWTHHRMKNAAHHTKQRSTFFWNKQVRANGMLCREESGSTAKFIFLRRHRPEIMLSTFYYFQASHNRTVP